ncbi:MAG: urate hydroxylase PuuD [Candidatus Velthaea sp.]
MSAYALDWLNLVARWFHITAGIAWIGASFYFVWLDNHLTPPRKAADAGDGVLGEVWSVHGGGFYHNQKYLTGPRSEPLTHDLHWFKWEAYATWFSGMAMLAIVYWAGASTFLIDRSVLAIGPAAAIAVSIGSIVVGWLVYDALCRALFARPVVLGAIIYAAGVAAAYGLFHVFSGRAAYIHVGAIIGTIMVANVFFVIIPGQRAMLAQIRAGEEPDPRPGRLGKIRSVHNTYLTLPVLFIMISNHYPMTYGAPYAWLVLAALGAAGVLVRRFFILTHARRYVPALLAAAAVLIVGVAVALAPHGGALQAGSATFATAGPIVAQRCAVCHAANPTQPGFSAPPQGVMLDTPERIAAMAQRIDEQAVRTRAMPLGNITGMTDDERATLGAWIAGGAKLR